MARIVRRDRLGKPMTHNGNNVDTFRLLTEYDTVEGFVIHHYCLRRN